MRSSGGCSMRLCIAAGPSRSGRETTRRSRHEVDKPVRLRAGLGARSDPRVAERRFIATLRRLRISSTNGPLATPVEEIALADAVSITADGRAGATDAAFGAILQVLHERTG